MFTGRTDPVPSSPAASNRSDGFAAALSPGSIDRVFPIRSAVSIDPTATPMARHESRDGFPGLRLNNESSIAQRRDATSSQRSTSRSPPHSVDRHVSQDGTSTKRTTTVRRASDIDRSAQGPAGARLEPQVNILSDINSTKSDQMSASAPNSVATRPPSMHTDDGALLTARFKHIVNDGGHAIITGRDGETLQRCEDEPIHIPGAIQSFGLLIGFKEQDGKLVVRVVSENSAKIIGYTPTQLFALDNFIDIFTDEQADNLLDHLDFIRDDEATDVVANGPEVFMLSIRPPQHRTRKLWCAMHIAESDKEMVICEMEIEDDLINPLVSSDGGSPEPPEDTLGSKPTAEELAESTVNVSKPLRVLRSARKKRGEAAAMEVFNIMSQVQDWCCEGAIWIPSSDDLPI
jgi:hypothetical protein